MLQTYSHPRQEVTALLSPTDVMRLQALADGVYLDDELYDYVLALTRYTRRHPQVQLGASPRASLALVHAARAHALIAGRDFVLPDDVKFLAPSVLAHRVLLTPDAQLEGAAPESVIAEALERVPWRRPGAAAT